MVKITLEMSTRSHSALRKNGTTRIAAAATRIATTVARLAESSPASEALRGGAALLSAVIRTPSVMAGEGQPPVPLQP